MRLLKQCGYRIAVLESGFYYTDQMDADLRLTGSGILNEFEGLLLADTPAGILAEALQMEPPAESYAAHRQRVLDGFNQLKRATRSRTHICLRAPDHAAPAVYLRRRRQVRSRWCAAILSVMGMISAGTLDEYRSGYAGQVQFANRKLEQAIDLPSWRTRKSPR